MRLNASSRALASFLTAAFGGVPFADGANVLCALDALLLLQQNDCMRPLQSAITELKVRVMEGEVCPMQAFVLGAHLRDLDLCRTAIVYGDVPAATPAPPPASYRAQVNIKTEAVDNDVFCSDSEDESDPSDSSFCSPTRLTYEADALDANKSVMEHLERIPQEYRSAMTQAWNSSSDPKFRGNSFVRLMCLLQRRCSVRQVADSKQGMTRRSHPAAHMSPFRSPTSISASSHSSTAIRTCPLSHCSLLLPIPTSKPKHTTLTIPTVPISQRSSSASRSGMSDISHSHRSCIMCHLSNPRTYSENCATRYCETDVGDSGVPRSVMIKSTRLGYVTSNFG